MSAKTTLVAAAAAVATLAAAGTASAYTLNLDSYVSTPVFPADTRLAGSATNSATTIDGTNTTVRLQTTETGNPAGTNQEKAAPFFNAGAVGPIGTLGDLGRGGLTADWLLESRGATSPAFVANIAAFRLLVDGPTVGTVAELVWETGYQSPVPTFDQGVGYNDVNIGGGKFWSRFAGQNYGQGDNGPVNALTLSQLAAGQALTPNAPLFSEATNVYGLQVSVGSDAGDYVGYVGDINASFVAVPEPATLAATAAAGLLALRRRRA